MNKIMSPKVKKILIRLLLVLGGIIIVSLIFFGGVKANDYWQVNKLVKVSDDLAKQEKYQDAYNDLTLAQARWTTAVVRKKIETKMGLNKQLIADADSYTKGKDLFEQSKWQEAKDNYSKISDKFPHYNESQDKILECQKKIDETNALAEQQKQAEEQKAKQSTNVSDPFPSSADYSQCDGLTGYESFSCSWSVGDQYKHDKEAWYARHGQTMPQATPSQTLPKRSICSWVGDLYSCNYY